MSSIDTNMVLLTCTQARTRLPFHGSRTRRALAEVPSVVLPPRPDRHALDPVLTSHDPRRVVVEGTDADLAAVLVRLLRTERLDVEVAYLADRPTDATRAWGLPTGPAAARLALGGTASAVPLIRDDNGGVLVGRGHVEGMRGECYCDETLVLRGQARWLVAAPGPGGIAVRAGDRPRRPDGRVEPVPVTAASGQGSAHGRAVQLGGPGMTVVHDGVAHPRELTRWTWFRHTADWRLVR